MKMTMETSEKGALAADGNAWLKCAIALRVAEPSTPLPGQTPRKELPGPHELLTKLTEDFLPRPSPSLVAQIVKYSTLHTNPAKSSRQRYGIRDAAAAVQPQGGGVPMELRRLVSCIISTLLTVLTMTTRALAQTPGSLSSTASVTSTPAGAITVVAVVMGTLVVLGIGVKLYDLKRKREEDACALQARLSDAFLGDPSLVRLPVTASVHMPVWRRSPPVIEIMGTVPTPELRDTAVQLVERELAGRSDAQIENRAIVDPLMLKRVA
jgi:uncharacterized integral membrane protein